MERSRARGDGARKSRKFQLLRRTKTPRDSQLMSLVLRIVSSCLAENNRQRLGPTRTAAAIPQDSEGAREPEMGWQPLAKMGGKDGIAVAKESLKPI